jgi:hypothetical protein
LSICVAVTYAVVGGVQTGEAGDAESDSEAQFEVESDTEAPDGVDEWFSDDADDEVLNNVVMRSMFAQRRTDKRS